MKRIKAFGLTALAAVMGMALFGAPSAMGESTALCKEDVVSISGEVCPVSQRISHIHAVSVGKGTILSSLGTVLCDVLILGDVTSANNLGNPLTVLGNFTYTNCEKHGGGTCFVTQLSTDAVFNILKLGHELTDVTYSVEFEVSCAFWGCIYNAVGLTAHGLGPLLAGTEHGETQLNNQTLNKVGGLLCPKVGDLDLITNWLENTYIAK